MAGTVYKQYDQQQLDAQFNLRARHPEFQDHFDWYEQASERARGDLECRLDVPYGDSSLQKLDVFPAATAGAPVQVYIHGGYWQSLDKSFFSYPAAPMVGAGAAFVSINYDLAPNVTIDEIVRQCGQALDWCYRNAASFNGDAERLYVSGHSAGAHLGMMMLTRDWSADGGLPAPAVKGVSAISGVFDLESIRLSYQNEVLRLDAEAARRNSPLYNLPRHGVPLIAAVGADETDEFRRQNGMLATAWRARGFHCEELTVPGQNHFDIVKSLQRADDPLTRAMLAQMGL
ncbi:MAG: alpha/beta hydrolase [bacterium]